MALKFILVAQENFKISKGQESPTSQSELFLLATDPFTPMQSYSPQSGYFWGQILLFFLDPKTGKVLLSFFFKKLKN